MKTPLDPKTITPGQLEVRVRHLLKKGEILPFIPTDAGKKFYPNGISGMVYGEFFGLPVIAVFEKDTDSEDFDAAKDVDLFYVNPRHDLYALFQDGHFLNELERTGSLPELFEKEIGHE